MIKVCFPVALCAALIAGAPASAQMMGHGAPTPMSMSDYRAARPGQPVKLVVRVARLKRTSLKAQILAHQSGNVYTSSGQNVDLYFADGTSVVMGSPRDLTPGAVVYIEGVATSHDNADVKRVIVISTISR